MSDYKLIDVTRLTKFKEKLLGNLTYTSPAADATNTSIEFIDTVSQSNGKISASKKKVSVFTGATTTKAGTTGLVPASGTGDVGKFLKGDGTWDNPPNTTYSVYTYSTTSKAGTTGLVPQPGTNAVGKFLKGGSGWSDLPTASTTNSGIVSLSSSTNSEAENAAATPKAVKAVYAAASTAGATAGANAASSYATAAKNSASNASTYATNAKNSADSAADAASTAVTNKIKDLKYDDPSASTATSTTFISNISQSNGVISATKKTLPLSNTINNDVDKAATPKAVNDAIKNLSYTDPTDGTATETSTTFISNISQSNGVISATKKKLPTFAGSSQPGIVSASEGLSENYLLNATGGWTAIDEELDATSTNPVQNKTLYNLETYHTLTNINNNKYIIDDGSRIVKVGESVKLFFNEKLMANYEGDLYIKNGGNNKKVIINQEENLDLKFDSLYSKFVPEISSEYCFLSNHNVFNGFDDEGNEKYINTFIAKGTAIELILTEYNSRQYFVIVGDPIVGTYRLKYNYVSLPVRDSYATAVVYASGLKIQWGTFTKYTGSHDEVSKKEAYFPIKFEQTPSMSFTFSTNSGNVARNDVPYAIDNKKWYLDSDYEQNNGTWIAIGY